MATSEHGDRAGNAGQADHEDVGPRMRRFRKEREFTLRDLSARTGLSIGFLSQVERGISAIGLTALRDVAAALGRSTADFFDSEKADVTPPPNHFTLLRAADPDTRYVSGQRTYRMLSDRGPHLVLEPLLVHIAPGGRREENYAHDGEEFAYVLEGELLYTVNGVEYRLGPGDSVHLRSNVPHSIYNDTEQVTKVVSVVTPRLF